MPDQKRGGHKSAVRFLLSILIGILFLLPHIVRMEVLHTVRNYSPFSALSSSPTTIDETYMYASEVNYTYRQHRLAYDTDAYEHRMQPMPYSLLPTEAEVLLARLFGSVAAAQIFCYFLFPAITAWLLMGMFLKIDASVLLAALLALFTLVASFSIQTFEIGIRELLLHGLHSGFIETLQASRNPNPNMTFPLFLGALLAQLAALLRRSLRYAWLAGLLGGLLFYSYVFYAIAWAACIALLTLIAWLRFRTWARPTVASLLTTVFAALPFLLWVRAAKKTGGYIDRSNRMGMVHSHLPNLHELKLSIIYAACLVLLWILWRYRIAKRSPGYDATPSFAAALVFGCAAAGGIAGMNMQLLTGFNVQAAMHYSHMVVQPALVLLSLVTFIAATETVRQKQSSLWAAALFIAFFAVCAANQVEAAVNSAPLHRMIPWQQALFHWLNHNTQPGDVVATTSIVLAMYMPVHTQDCTLMVNGSRTSASDSEILDRYLLASALTGASPSTVEQELAPKQPTHQPWTNYPSFFFEYSPDLNTRQTLKSTVVQAALAKYRSLNLSSELRHYRVNYLYAENGRNPVQIEGMQWQRVFTTTNGSLWRLSPMQVSR